MDGVSLWLEWLEVGEWKAVEMGEMCYRGRLETERRRDEGWRGRCDSSETCGRGLEVFVDVEPGAAGAAGDWGSKNGGNTEREVLSPLNVILSRLSTRHSSSSASSSISSGINICGIW
jgi:hypothetical protein